MDLASVYLPSQVLVTATNLAQELWKSSYSNLVGFTVYVGCVCVRAVWEGTRTKVLSLQFTCPRIPASLPASPCQIWQQTPLLTEPYLQPQILCSNIIAV